MESGPVIAQTDLLFMQTSLISTNGSKKNSKNLYLKS